MRYGDDLVRQVRSIMGPGNPVPSHSTVGSWQDERGREIRQRILAQYAGPDGSGASRRSASGAGGRTRTGGGPPAMPGLARQRAWRVIAPVTAALAVAGLVVGLTLASLAGGRRPVTEVASLPGFYVTVMAPGQGNPGALIYVEVHDSATGQVLSRVEMAASNDLSAVSVTADRSDRAFLLTLPRSHASRETDLYLLRVSASGHSASLRRLKLVLVGAGSNVGVEDIALSPDGTRLAVSFVSPLVSSSIRPHAKIAVYSLTGGVTQTWTAPGLVAIVRNLAWTSDGELAFTLLDHLGFNSSGFLSHRSQIRVLDTAAHSRNLLSSRLLATDGGRLGSIVGTMAGRAGTPLIVAAYRDIPAGPRSGTVIQQVASLSPSGKTVRVLFRHAVAYHTPNQMYEAEAVPVIYGLDATGRHVLVICPRFGWVSAGGAFTPLPQTSDRNPLVAAAWW